MVPAAAGQRRVLPAARSSAGGADLPGVSPLTEPRWLAAVRVRAGTRRADIVARTPLPGGYVAARVQRIELLLDGAREVTVVLKQTRPTEAVALRALSRVPGVRRPRLVAAGPGWLVLPYYGDATLGPDGSVPAAVYDTLARVHHHYLHRPPAGLPVVDAMFWRRLCGQVARPAVLAAGLPDVRAALAGWADDHRVHTVLGLLPATLAHGDLHRGNVLLGADGPTIIDWGNARIAPGGLLPRNG